MTAQEAAEKWGITKRRVQILCVENRIEGAQRLGTMWAIPQNTEKPADARIKKTIITIVMRNKIDLLTILWLKNKTSVRKNFQEEF